MSGYQPEWKVQPKAQEDMWGPWEVRDHDLKIKEVENPDILVTRGLGGDQEWIEDEDYMVRSLFTALADPEYIPILAQEYDLWQGRGDPTREPEAGKDKIAFFYNGFVRKVPLTDLGVEANHNEMEAILDLEERKLNGEYVIPVARTELEGDVLVQEEVRSAFNELWDMHPVDRQDFIDEHPWINQMKDGPQVGYDAGGELRAFDGFIPPKFAADLPEFQGVEEKFLPLVEKEWRDWQESGDTSETPLSGRYKMVFRYNGYVRKVPISTRGLDSIRSEMKAIVRAPVPIVDTELDGDVMVQEEIVENLYSEIMKDASEWIKEYPWLKKMLYSKEGPQVGRTADGELKAFDGFDVLGSRKHAAPTKTKLMNQASELPEDHSVVVYTFDDGWTIRELQDFADAHREGVLMGNCIDPYSDFCRRTLDYQDNWGADHDQVTPLVESREPMSDVVFSLRDPDNIPYVSIDPMSNGYSENIALGRNNSIPKPEYIDRLRKWMEDDQYFRTYDIFGLEQELDDYTLRISKYVTKSVVSDDRPGETARSWHLTDNPRFRLNQNYAPANNTTMGGDYEPGIFMGHPEKWWNGYDYVRPYAVEIEYDPSVVRGGGYGGEIFLPASEFDKARVVRVIPVDDWVKEEYGLRGWLEDFYDEGEPSVGANYPYRGYRYEGPDVREMDFEEHRRHLNRVDEYIRKTRPWMLDEDDPDFRRQGSVRLSSILDPVQDELDQRVFDGITPRADLFDPYLNRLKILMRDNGWDPSMFSYWFNGSLCTYQYGPGSDVDVSIIAKDGEDFSDEDRSDLVRLILTMDGDLLADGISYPLQHFVQPSEVNIYDLFGAGVKSAYDLDAHKWLIPPNKDRAFDVEGTHPDWLVEAVQIADKMSTLLDAGHVDEAWDMYEDLHEKRKEAFERDRPNADTSQANVNYKYLDRSGVMARVYEAAGKIAPGEKRSHVKVAEEDPLGWGGGEGPLAETIRAQATDWATRDPDAQKQAIANALRVAILSPMKLLKHNAIHYQDLMDIPYDETDPQVYIDRINEAREQWNHDHAILKGRDDAQLDMLEAPPEPLRPDLAHMTAEEKYAGVIFKHLRYIANLSNFIPFLYDAAMKDISQGGTGKIWREALREINVSGANDKVSSFSWLLLAPETSQLATIDTHMIRSLGIPIPNNPKRYDEAELMMEEIKNKMGYEDMPLGTFQWGLWDYVRSGPGTHQVHGPLKPVDPIPYHEEEWLPPVRGGRPPQSFLDHLPLREEAPPPARKRKPKAPAVGDQQLFAKRSNQQIFHDGYPWREYFPEEDFKLAADVSYEEGYLWDTENDIRIRPVEDRAVDVDGEDESLLYWADEKWVPEISREWDRWMKQGDPSIYPKAGTEKVVFFYNGYTRKVPFNDRALEKMIAESEGRFPRNPGVEDMIPFARSYMDGNVQVQEEVEDAFPEIEHKWILSEDPTDGGKYPWMEVLRDGPQVGYDRGGELRLYDSKKRVEWS